MSSLLTVILVFKQFSTVSCRVTDYTKLFTPYEDHSLIYKTEKLKAGIRAKVEYPFSLIKRQFGYVKVRYRGLKKNTAQLLTLFALSNLWMVRGKLMQAQA